MSSEPTSPLRRHFSRIPFHIAARLSLAGQECSVEVLDLALKGALVSVPTGIKLNLGDTCELSLVLSTDGEAIIQQCQVVHHHEQHYGLKSLELDVDSMTSLRRLLELNLGDGDLVDRELLQLFAASNPH